MDTCNGPNPDPNLCGEEYFSEYFDSGEEGAEPVPKPVVETETATETVTTPQSVTEHFSSLALIQTDLLPNGSKYYDTPHSKVSRKNSKQYKATDSVNVIVSTDCDGQKSNGYYTYLIFHMMLTLIAVYLTFRCNEEMSFGSVFMAVVFPYVYIIYILATRGTCGILETPKSFNK